MKKLTHEFYTDEPKHWVPFPNEVLVFHALVKQLLDIDSTKPLKIFFGIWSEDINKSLLIS